MSFAYFNRVWTPDTLTDPEDGAFTEARASYDWIEGITVHHCYAPSLAMRPKGLLAEHMVNLRDYYRNKLGWSTGPQFFTDEDQIFGLTPPTERGTHAASFNREFLGIEMLGNFDEEDPKSGRGLEVVKTTCRAIVRIQQFLGLHPEAFNFHRDDPKTRKTCPGVRITRDWFLQQLQMAAQDLTSNSEAAKRNHTIENVVSGVVMQAGKQCVPVSRYLADHGVWDSQRFENRGGEFYYRGIQLEGAWYDKPTEKTWAPISELVEFTL